MMSLFLLCLFALLSASPGRAATEVLNKKNIELQSVNGVRYVALDVFQDTLGLEGDQTLSGAYRLFGSPGLTRDVVLEFSAGSNRVLVNDKETTLTHPPINAGGILLLPYDEFVGVLMPDAAKETKPAGPAPAGPTTLL